MKALRAEVHGRELSLSNVDKVLYPETGFTKGQVIEYYLKIAETIIPYLRDRALTLKRYPSGVDGEFFYEKRCPVYRPKWVNTADIPSERSGTVGYCVINDPAALVWVANLASLEMHVLLSKVKDPQRPTMMVFDLDPGAPADILDCARVALRLRELLAGAKLETFLKTSGGKGLHAYVPLNTPVTFEQTKEFSRQVAMILERDDPTRVTSNMSKKLRVGKVFVDWSQNDSHKTTVAAYSLRARPRPTVSTPIEWPELQKALRATNPGKITFEADEVLKRVAKRGDPMAPLLTMRQRLPSGL